ncbi:unnamed protein product [Penicillium bialowiezense]
MENSLPFDPYTQNVTMLYADGTPFNTSIPMLNVFVQYNVRVCINYGVQFGASLVLLVILLLLTHADKRRSAVFLLNGLALLFNSIRLLFQVIHFETGFEKVYEYFSGDYSAVPAICIEISLVLQLNVVCSTLRRRYRRPLLGLSLLLALVPIVFRFWFMVENCKLIISLNYMAQLWWIESGTNISLTVSICFFCTVFVVKLGFAIRQRRRLGVREFGPMKVIFVMGCQTMIAPAIFSIAQYYITVPELNSNVVTLVVISLPLSSIWAGAALESSRNLRSRDQHRRNFWRSLAGGADSPTFPSTVPSKASPTSLSSMGAAQTLCYSDRTSTTKGSPTSRDSDAFYGIEVEHDISVDRAQKKNSLV